MRRLALLGWVVWLGGLAASAAGQPNSDQAPVKVEKSWSGRLLGADKEALRKLAPATGYVSDAKVFAALWKAWRTEEKVPEVDFAKKLVLVATAKGPNEVQLLPRRDPKGNLTADVQATLVGGPGFGYILAVVDRDGIKSVQGMPLDGAK